MQIVKAPTLGTPQETLKTKPGEKGGRRKKKEGRRSRRDHLFCSETSTRVALTIGRQPTTLDSQPVEKSKRVHRLRQTNKIPTLEYVRNWYR